MNAQIKYLNELRASHQREQAAWHAERAAFWKERTARWVDSNEPEEAKRTRAIMRKHLISVTWANQRATEFAMLARKA